MKQHEINQMLSSEALNLLLMYGSYLNQSKHSIEIFNERSKLNSIVCGKVTNLDDLRRICKHSIKFANKLKEEATRLKKTIEEFEDKGTFQTTIK